MPLKRPKKGLLSFSRVKSEFTVMKSPVYPTETQGLLRAKLCGFRGNLLLSVFFIAS